MANKHANGLPEKPTAHQAGRPYNSFYNNQSWQFIKVSNEDQRRREARLCDTSLSDEVMKKRGNLFSFSWEMLSYHAGNSTLLWISPMPPYIRATHSATMLLSCAARTSLQDV